VAGGDVHGFLWMWDVPSGEKKCLLRDHSREVTSLALSPDGKTLASVSKDRTIRLREISAIEKSRRIETPSPVNGIAFAPDGKTLASAHADGRIRIWDVSTGKDLHPEYAATGEARSLVFFPDDKTLALERDPAYDLFETATGKQLRRMDDVTFSPNRKTFVENDRDGIRLKDLATGKEVRRFQGQRQRADKIVFSPNGKILAASCPHEGVYLWDVATGKLLRRLDPLPPKGWLIGVGSDGQVIVWGDDASSVRYMFTLCIRNVARDKDVTRLQSCPFFPLVFSPDGKRMATLAPLQDAATAEIAVLFDLTAGKEIKR